MAKLPKVDVFKCDKCGSCVIVDSHTIKTTSPYCWSSDVMELTEDNFENAEMIPNKINTVQLPYISRNYIEVQDRGEVDYALGEKRGKVADKIKIAEYHICDDCMNDMKEDFIELMNNNQEFQEKYLDSVFETMI